MIDISLKANVINEFNDVITERFDPTDEIKHLVLVECSRAS